MADPAVTAEKLGAQLVLVQLRTGATFRLNATGQLIWELACAGQSETEIGQHLARTFNGAGGRCQEDTRALLNELTRQHLLQPRTEGST
ncbi:MAG: PqqD family protein [Planctomycetia bacterium]|nr:PqqD family protein [Planctomycetia bacterium]